VDAFTINTRSMLSPGGYWSEMGKLDCVLDIGAGDSFADIYGLKRFLFLWLSKELAYLRGLPLVFSPQTIGPFTKQPYLGLARRVMNKAAAVVARDPASLEAARKIAPRARLLQAVDVAFLLPFERMDHGAPGKIHVGVNVSGLLFNGGYTSANEFGLDVDYAAMTRKLLAALTARPDVVVHLICHVNTDAIPADDDRAVADLLKTEFPGVVRAPNFNSPTEAKSYIAGLDFLTAARMHACIAAFSAGVPVVPVAYSRKFSGLFQGVLQYPYEVPVRGLGTDEAVAYILARLEERETLKTAAHAGLAVVGERLRTYGDELQRVFRLAADRKAGDR
jgi:polysaccharide pyruvyl transferase WcaK-like protein